MWQPKISKIVSEKTTFEEQTYRFVKLVWLFCKTIFFSRNFVHSVLSFGVGSTAELGVSSFFHGITEAVPSPFQEFFLYEIPFPTLVVGMAPLPHRLKHLPEIEGR